MCLDVFGGSEIWKFVVFWSGLTVWESELVSQDNGLERTGSDLGEVHFKVQTLDYLLPIWTFLLQNDDYSFAILPRKGASKKTEEVSLL